MAIVSIIIPTLNSSHSVKRCLNSISCQSFLDYEVILKDGGSSDDTIKIAESYANNDLIRSLRILQCEDSGVYDAMNQAAQFASGEWIYFLGSDDELFDRDVLSKIFASKTILDCDVLYGNVKIVGDTGWSSDGSIYDGQFDLDKLLVKNICHQSIFYRLKHFRKIGIFNTEYKLCADWDFNMRCWAVSEFRFVDLIVANFYSGGKSSSGNLDDPQFELAIADNVNNYFGTEISKRFMKTAFSSGTNGEKKKISGCRQLRNILRRIINRIS